MCTHITFIVIVLVHVVANIVRGFWRFSDKIFQASVHLTAKANDGKVIEDTRWGAGPFSLRLGKKFCLPALEAAVRSMHLGEVTPPLMSEAFCHRLLPIHSALDVWTLY